MNEPILLKKYSQKKVFKSKFPKIEIIFLKFGNSLFFFLLKNIYLFIIRFFSTT